MLLPTVMYKSKFHSKKSAERIILFLLYFQSIVFFWSSNVQNISRKNHKSVDVNFNSV